MGIEEIRAYIANTPAPRLSERSRRAFIPGASDMQAICSLVNESGTLDAIALALEYGRSMGYCMGRREAQVARGVEREAVV